MSSNNDPLCGSSDAISTSTLQINFPEHHHDSEVAGVGVITVSSFPSEDLCIEAPNFINEEGECNEVCIPTVIQKNRYVVIEEKKDENEDEGENDKILEDDEINYHKLGQELDQEKDQEVNDDKIDQFQSKLMQIITTNGPDKSVADSDPLEDKQELATPAVEIPDTECSICLFESVEVVLPCAHAFCENCIKDWTKKTPECPVCRSSLEEKVNFRMEVTRQSRANSFFDLVEVTGKDNVIQDLEPKIELLVNGAVKFLLERPDYDLYKCHSSENPHIKLDIKTYGEQYSKQKQEETRTTVVGAPKKNL